MLNERRQRPPLPRRFIFRPTLRLKLTALMLTTSLSLVAILLFLYYQTEKTLYNEFQRRTSELSKAVQIGLEGASGKGLSDSKSLEKYLNSLNSKGIREISVISSGDRIVASTNDENVGKWITEWRKQMIINAELGETVTEDEQFYNVILPVFRPGKPLASST